MSPVWGKRCRLCSVSGVTGVLVAVIEGISEALIGAILFTLAQDND